LKKRIEGGKLLKEIKVAVPTRGGGGLKDDLSDVFGRAKTFTIVDVEGGEVKKVEVLQNPAVSYKHGTGPIVVKMLIDAGVNVVLAKELGPGSSALLEQHHVTIIPVEPGISVSEAIKKVSWTTINIQI
jgi:predicted Fe-Mo cluster-binding NifX family protein